MRTPSAACERGTVGTIDAPWPRSGDPSVLAVPFHPFPDDRVLSTLTCFRPADHHPPFQIAPTGKVIVRTAGSQRAPNTLLSSGARGASSKKDLLYHQARHTRLAGQEDRYQTPARFLSSRSGPESHRYRLERASRTRRDRLVFEVAGGSSFHSWARRSRECVWIARVEPRFSWVTPSGRHARAACRAGSVNGEAVRTDGVRYRPPTPSPSSPLCGSSVSNSTSSAIHPSWVLLDEKGASGPPDDGEATPAGSRGTVRSVWVGRGAISGVSLPERPGPGVLSLPR